MKLSQINEAKHHEHSSYHTDDEPEEIINANNFLELGWKRGYRPITVYKATNNPTETAIPGFTTKDPEEAKAYLGQGDWGGEHLVQINITSFRETTTSDMHLDGQEGPIKIEAGTPAILIRGTEVMILKPEKQKIIQQ
jgi:hypothetical protein